MRAVIGLLHAAILEGETDNVYGYKIKYNLIT